MRRGGALIFVTVGGHTPFDRLIRTVDEWAADHPEAELFAQIGDGAYEPCHMPWVRFLSPPEFNQHVRQASSVVAHAGMGTILTGLALGKPILVLPRTAELRETRSDHQLATARHLEERKLVHVAMTEEILGQRLGDLDRLEPAQGGAPALSSRLRDTIRRFIEEA